MFKNWPKKKIGFLFLVVIFILVVFFYFDYLHRPPNDYSLSVTDNIINLGTNNEITSVIDEPVFESISAANSYLENEGQGIVLMKNHEAKFYPFQIFLWHYGVNDIWNGQPVLVVYNPFCGNATVFKRTDSNGQILILENSGKLYNNQILFSETSDDTLWESLNGHALYGTKVDQIMDLVPSFVTTWQIFKKNFPQGQVLSRETGAEYDYSFDPNYGYQTSSEVFYPLEKYNQTFPLKTKIFTYNTNNFYPEDNIKSNLIINDQEIRLVWDDDWQAVRGYRISDDEEVGLFSGYWMCWAAVR